MKLNEALEIVLAAADGEVVTIEAFHGEFEEEFEKVDEIRAAMSVVRLFAESADLDKLQKELITYRVQKGKLNGIYSYSAPR